MIVTTTCIRQTLMVRLVPLSLMAVGQAQAALLLVCPTVPPFSAPRTCGRSGQSYARVTRTRVFINLSLHEKKVKEVGQWGTVFDLGVLPCPTFNLNSGAGQTDPKSASRGDVFADIHRAFTCVTHLFTGGIKSGLLP